MRGPIGAVLAPVLLAAAACTTPCPKVAGKGEASGTIRIPPGETAYRARFIGRPSESQPPSGRPIACLRAFRGKIYAGYGDWTENTGPILVVGYDPERHRFDCGPEISTEAIDVIRVIGDRMVIPETDYSGWFWFHSDVHFFDGDAWTSVRLPRAIHVFDVAEYKGKLYVAYQYNPRSDVEKMHRVGVIENGTLTDPASLEVGAMGRILRLSASGGKLYAFPQVGSVAYEFDGARWSPRKGGFSGVRGWIKTETDGTRTVVLGRNLHLGYVNWHLYAIDREGKSVPIGEHAVVGDLKVVDGTWYALRIFEGSGKCTVVRSHDLKTWEPVVGFHADSSPSAMEILNGVIYVGLRNGELWRLDP